MKITCPCCGKRLLLNVEKCKLKDAVYELNAEVTILQKDLLGREMPVGEKDKGEKEPPKTQKRKKAKKKEK